MSWLLRKLGIASRKDIDKLYKINNENLDLHLLASSMIDDIRIKILELEKKKKK